MAISKLFATLFAFIALIGLCPDYTQTQQSSVHDLALKQINTLTFRPTSQQGQTTTVSIDQIMQTIMRNEPLPNNAAITCNGKQYRVKQGVSISKTDHTVFIFSRGYERKPYSARSSYLYTHHIAPDCPLVCFDYDDSRKSFSFGQEQDIEALEAVYAAVLQKNPHANIVLIGNCNGSKVALELATKKPRNLKALILLSPLISGEKTIDHMAHSFHIPRKIMHAFFKRLCPQYNPECDTLWDRIHLIDTKIPIFIGQRRDDLIVADDEVRQLAKRLKASGNRSVHGVIVADSRKLHDNVYLNETIQQRINQFLQNYGLPYTPQHNNS